MFTAGAEVFTQVAAGPSSVIVQNSQTTATLAVGGSAATVGTQIISADGSGNIVLGPGSSQTTITPAPSASGDSGVAAVFTVGSQTFTAIHAGPSSMIIQNSQTTATVPANGAAASVGSEQVLIDGSGNLVVGTGPNQRTITAAPAVPSAVTYGSGGALSMYSLPGGSYIVQAGSTTVTLSPGSSPVTLGNDVVSAGSAGVVLGVGQSQTTTILVGAEGALVAPATLGSTAIGGYQVVELPSSSWAVVDGTSTLLTLTPGGVATTIDRQMISAASNGGLAVSSGTVVTTLDLSPTTTSAGPGTPTRSVDVNAAATSSGVPLNSAAIPGLVSSPRGIALMIGCAACAVLCFAI